MGKPEYCDLKKREYKGFTGMLGFVIFGFGGVLIVVACLA
jgi:hypothetical protein